MTLVFYDWLWSEMCQFERSREAFPNVSFWFSTPLELTKVLFIPQT